MCIPESVNGVDSVSLFCFDCNFESTIQTTLEVTLSIQLGVSAEGDSAPAWGVVRVERCVQGGEPYQRGTHLKSAYRSAGCVCLTALWECRVLINHRATLVKHTIHVCKLDECEHLYDVGMQIIDCFINR